MTPLSDKATNQEREFILDRSSVKNLISLFDNQIKWMKFIEDLQGLDLETTSRARNNRQTLETVRDDLWEEL